MNYIFQPDLVKRKKFLKNIAKKNPTWVIRMICFWLLMVLAAGILIAIGCVLFSQKPLPNVETFIGFFMAGVCIACVPFFIGISVKNTAKYKCASTYSGMTNGTLILNDDSFEYVYWKSSKEAPAAYSSKRAYYRDQDKFTYRFERNMIRSLKIDESHICNIVGQGTLTVPMWASSNDTIETTPIKHISFVMCFKEENCEEILLKWRES